MSDLIDLNSPDTSKVLRRELASPLIPPPVGIVKDDFLCVTNGLPNLMAGKINKFYSRIIKINVNLCSHVCSYFMFN